MPKKRRYRTPFDSHFVKSFQTFAKSPWQYFYHIFSSLFGKLCWKISFSVICETFRHLDNILTADNKFFLCNNDNFIWNYHCYKEKTCYLQSICYQDAERFHILLKKRFSNTIFQRVMKKYDKSTVMEISQMFGNF